MSTQTTTISKEAFSALEGAFHREIRGLLSKKLQGQVMGKFRQALASTFPTVPLPDVDGLAQEIRRVDGNHDLGAAGLAEALQPFLQAQGFTTVTAEMVRRAEHYCPTDMPSCDKWEWKARHIRQEMTGPKFLEIPAFLRHDAPG
jgi:hypothetical protein